MTKQLKYFMKIDGNHNTLIILFAMDPNINWCVYVKSQMRNRPEKRIRVSIKIFSTETRRDSASWAEIFWLIVRWGSASRAKPSTTPDADPLLGRPTNATWSNPQLGLLNMYKRIYFSFFWHIAKVKKTVWSYQLQLSAYFLDVYWVWIIIFKRGMCESKYID